MSIRSFFLVILIIIRAVVSAAAAQDASQPAGQSQIGYKSAANAEQKKTLLLKDFQPVSMLHTETHSVDRAK